MTIRKLCWRSPWALEPSRSDRTDCLSMKIKGASFPPGPALRSSPLSDHLFLSSSPHLYSPSLRPAGCRLSDLFIKAGRRDQLRSCRTSLSSEWAGFESGPAKKKKEFVADHTKFLVFNLTSSYKLELNYLGKDGPIVCFSHVTIPKILILIFTAKHGRQVQVQ